MGGSGGAVGRVDRGCVGRGVDGEDVEHDQHEEDEERRDDAELHGDDGEGLLRARGRGASHRGDRHLGDGDVELQLQVVLGAALLIWTGLRYEQLHAPLRRGESPTDHGGDLERILHWKDGEHPVADELEHFATVTLDSGHQVTLPGATPACAMSQRCQIAAVTGKFIAVN